MKFRLIQHKEATCLFKEAYNPPIFDREFTMRDFDEEYWRVHQAVRTALGQQGTFSYSGQGDFCMNETRGASSRWLSVARTTDRMWNQSLVPSISRALVDVGQSYLVYVSHEMLEFPLYHLLVAKDEVLGWCDDPEDLPTPQAFGFSPAG